MPRRKGRPKSTKSTLDDSVEASSTESDTDSKSQEDSPVNSKSPVPRARHTPGRRRKRTTAKYTYEDSESDDQDLDALRACSIGKDENPEPPAGIFCKKHKRYDTPYPMRIRTLYSQFPRDYGRMIILHIISTFLIYLMVYPVVNFFWTYLINIDHEVATLFHYITEEPTYDGGLGNHFRKMRWLSWPPLNPESLALLIASAIKDTAILHWEGAMDDISLTNIVGRHIAKRYGRH